MTYLSELFLDTLGADFSRASVRRALEACNEEYLRRVDTMTVEELRDLMDCYYEFSGLITRLDLPLLMALEPLRRGWPTATGRHPAL